MTRASKRRNVIIAAILLVLTIFAGFFAFFNKSNKIKAGAESHTNSGLYFTDGAYATKEAADLYRMAFDLNIDKNIITDDTYGFSIMLYVEGVDLSSVIMTGAFFGTHLIPTIDEFEERNGVKVNNLTDYLGAVSAVIKTDDITWEEYTTLTLRICVRTPLTCPVYIKAHRIVSTDGGTTTELKDEAISATRSILNIMQSAIQYEDPIAAKNPYISSIVDFAEGDRNVFRINNDSLLNERTGMNLLLNIPISLQEELKKDEVFEWDGTTIDPLYMWGNLKKKYLVVTRAEDLEQYNTHNGYLSADEKYQHFWYSMGGEINRCKVDAELMPFTFSASDETLTEICLPEAPDADKTYYYYARIVEVSVRVMKWTISFTGDGYTGYGTSYIMCEKTSTYYATSTKSLAENLLTNHLYENENYYAYLQAAAGVTPSTELVDVGLKFKKWNEGNTTSRLITDGVLSFKVPREAIYNKRLVWREIAGLGYTHISAFNVVANSTYWMNSSYGDDGEVKTGDRIVLQAIDYEYTYNSNIEEGFFEIIYDEYVYGDFALIVTNNDPANNLKMDVYTPRVSYNNGNITLTYDYNEIETYLNRSCGWIFEMKPTDVTVIKIDHRTPNVSYDIGIEKLTVTVPEENQGELLYVSAYAVVEIFEDFNIVSEVEYVQLSLDENNDIVKEKVYTTQIASTCATERKKSWQSIYQEYQKDIDKGVTFTGLTGTYMEPVSVDRIEHWQEDETDLRVTFVVKYTVHTLFRLENSAHKYIGYVATNNSTLTYYADELLPASNLPEGNYVKNVATTSPIARVVNNADYTKTTIDLDYTNKDVIVPVTFTLSDEWNLKVNYMESWKTGEWITPFATQKTGTFTAKYSTYPNMLDITADDVAKIMGKTSRDDLMICGIAKPYEDVTVTFDGVDTYTTTLEYGSGNITSIGVNGETNHIDVPLTSFTDWAKTFMPEDSTPNVLMLNTKDKKWFTAGDVRSEDVYGYFAVAVFDTKVSDLDSHFQKNTGDGCMNIYATKQVKGSALYQFFGSMQGKGIITNLIGEICMAFCEIVNNENVVQYSHFFYLDGSSENPYISIGGADSPDDDDTAGENWGEDVKDEIEDTVNGIINGINENPMMDLIGMVVGAVVIGAGVAAIIWVIRWAFGSGSSGNKRRRR